MAFVRGANPIWFEVDLSANAFDDTFYLWVLENVIPYVPAPVYHQPNGIEWTDPIRFLANGTLPNDIYFDPDIVYRLEFRQNDGINPPSQSDPLIYLVENYQASGGGVGPIDNVAFTTDNQMSNPQFPLIAFSSPLALTSISTQSIDVGPGWVLDLVGTGNVTLTRQPLNDSATTINPTNAPYALEISVNGTWSSVSLRQRFNQNGMLWANKTVSSSITAKIEGAPQDISAILVDSNGTTLAEVLEPTTVNATFNEYKSFGTLGDTTNPDIPPAAWIEYRLILPTTVDILVTSFQLVVGDLELEYPYEQDTIERQIDHTYHNAYPIVPVGTVIDFGGFDVPEHYLLCDGAAYSRVTYNQLFQAVTTTETVTLTNSSNTFTVTSGARYRIGMGLENAAIPLNTTIIAISGNTITMSSPATATGSTSVRFFATGRTYSETVSLTNGVATFTVASAANYGIGMALTGSGIQSNTVIANIVGTTITMSKTATATQSSVVTFYAGGDGDGSTTFNVYNLTDYVVAGAGGSIFGGMGLTGLGSRGGALTHTLAAAELPPHSHTYSTVTSDGVFGFGFASGTLISSKSFNTGNGPGSSTPFSIVQPTALLYKCIRYQ